MNENQTPVEPMSRRAERHARRMGRHAGSEWIWGILLIALAAILLLRDLDIYTLNNWWSLFILIPALGAFGNAWRASRAAGRFDRQARSSLIVGVSLTLLTAMFLFGLNWAILGPGLMLFAGVSILINVVLPD